MASRKEERERRRAERLAAERRESSSGRLRLILGYAVAGVIGAAVLVGLVIAISGGGDAQPGEIDVGDVPESSHINTQVGVARGAEPDGREGTSPPPLQLGDLERSARQADCDLRVDLPEEGNQHFTDEDENPGWETNPPTSGDHYGVPTEPGAGALADGAYLETPSLGRVVHALEHGRIAVHYSPDLPEAEQLAIKGVFEEDPAGMMLFPNSEIPFAVAATAWQQKLGCQAYEGRATLDALRNFRDAYRGRGPENVPVHTGP
jgi:hypothetical protein